MHAIHQVVNFIIIVNIIIEEMCGVTPMCLSCYLSWDPTYGLSPASAGAEMAFPLPPPLS